MTLAHVLFALLTALLPACPVEDSPNCHWNAAEYGDRNGTSFVNIGLGHGTFLYLYEDGTAKLID